MINKAFLRSAFKKEIEAVILYVEKGAEIEEEAIDAVIDSLIAAVEKASSPPSMTHNFPPPQEERFIVPPFDLDEE